MVGSLVSVKVERNDDFYIWLCDKSIPVVSFADLKGLEYLVQCMLNYKAKLSEPSPKARLWSQYIEYVETTNPFIRA